MQQAVKSSLRRDVFRVATRSPRLRRRQHDSPHKEYFQKPGQFTAQYQQTFREPPPPVSPALNTLPQRSYLVRVSHSVSWALLFATLGIWAGTGLITYEYLQTPLALTEEEENELLDEVLIEMREHPLVAGLMEDGWHESKVYPERSRWEMQQGLDFIYERLMGTQGITIKEFTHPTLEYTVLVFFFMDGLEFWPDTIHNGIISSMLLLGAQRHIERCCLAKGENVEEGSLKLEVNFQARVQPADVYSVLVPPVSRITAPSLTTGEPVKLLKASPMMLHMEASPKIDDAQTTGPIGAQMSTHTIQIPTTAVGEAVYATASVDCHVMLEQTEAPEHP